MIHFFTILCRVGILATLFLYSGQVFGQYEHFANHQCAYDLGRAVMNDRYPGYEEQTARVFAEAKLTSELRGTSDEEYRVPVVVHIVWKEEDENLSDELIINQIETLNEDFRLRNPDRTQMRKIYSNRQGNPNIQFDLIEIRRVQTDEEYTINLFGDEILPDKVKRSADGGSDAADPNQFMNIWVCNIRPIPFLGAQILGYAYPPADLPNWPEDASAPSPELDGVVVHYRRISKDNPFSSNNPVAGVDYQNGRTLTHEVGHYLGLRHIWGDGGGIFGGNSCGEDDGVDDTPNQGRSSENDCNKEQNTCTEGAEADEPDMIENYMDYSSEFCMNSFTHGQVAIMRAVLEGPRSGLLEELPTSAGSEMVAKDIKIYPNPADQEIFIRHDEPLNGRIQVFNQNGQVVVSEVQMANNSAGTYRLDTGVLPDGMYILHIITSNGIFVQKFSVLH